MKILLTGAGGFLGSAVWRALDAVQLGEVVPVVRRPQAGAVTCDLGDPRAVTALLDVHRPDQVVNIAALADFQPGALARLLPVNTLAPGIMAAWCRSHDAYLLQASGTLVHGFSNTRFGPQTPIEPDTDYGRSKWLAEELIRSSGARASLIRLGGIFGVLGPDHLALNCTLRAALEGERPILKGPGNGRRNYLHVDDAARMVAWCVSSNAEGIYWAGGKEIVSLRELLEAVCEVFLPGSAIIEEPGNDAPDQVVEVSPELPSGCTLNEALIAERALHQ